MILKCRQVNKNLFDELDNLSTLMIDKGGQLYFNSNCFPSSLY